MGGFSMELTMHSRIPFACGSVPEHIRSIAHSLAEQGVGTWMEGETARFFVRLEITFQHLYRAVL